MFSKAAGDLNFLDTFFEDNGHCRSQTLFTLHGQFSPELLDDTLCDRQTQARSVVFFGGEKRFKETGQRFIRHPASIIFNRRCHCFMIGIPGCNSNGAPIFDCSKGVVQDIQKNLLQLPFISS